MAFVLVIAITSVIDPEHRIFKILNFTNLRLNAKERMQALFKRSACKPFWTMMVYVVIMELSGASIVFMWGVQILQVLCYFYSVYTYSKNLFWKCNVINGLFVTLEIKVFRKS